MENNPRIIIDELINHYDSLKKEILYYPQKRKSLLGVIDKTIAEISRNHLISEYLEFLEAVEKVLNKFNILSEPLEYSLGKYWYSNKQYTRAVNCFRKLFKSSPMATYRDTIEYFFLSAYHALQQEQSPKFDNPAEPFNFVRRLQEDFSYRIFMGFKFYPRSKKRIVSSAKDLLFSKSKKNRGSLRLDHQSSVKKIEAIEARDLKSQQQLVRKKREMLEFISPGLKSRKKRIKLKQLLKGLEKSFFDKFTRNPIPYLRASCLINGDEIAQVLNLDNSALVQFFPIGADLFISGINKGKYHYSLIKGGSSLINTASQLSKGINSGSFNRLFPRIQQVMKKISIPLKFLPDPGSGGKVFFSGINPVIGGGYLWKDSADQLLIDNHQLIYLSEFGLERMINNRFQQKLTSEVRDARLFDHSVRYKQTVKITEDIYFNQEAVATSFFVSNAEIHFFSELSGLNLISAPLILIPKFKILRHQKGNIFSIGPEQLLAQNAEALMFSVTTEGGKQLQPILKTLIPNFNNGFGAIKLASEFSLYLSKQFKTGFEKTNSELLSIYIVV